MKIPSLLTVGIVIPLCFGASNTFGDVISLYSNPLAYENALASLGLIPQVLDFETLPDGSPVGSGDVFISSPQVFNLTGNNSATFTTASRFIYENFTSVSPSHSLREDASASTKVVFGTPVFAVGVFALDIDNFVASAATAVYSSTTLSLISQQFDNSSGSTNAVAFLGAIATDDSLLVPRAILTQVIYDQSDAQTPEFTYLDNFSVAVPEPSMLALLTVGLSLVRFGRCKRKHL